MWGFSQNGFEHMRIDAPVVADQISKFVAEDISVQEYCPDSVDQWLNAVTPHVPIPLTELLDNGPFRVGQRLQTQMAEYQRNCVWNLKRQSVHLQFYLRFRTRIGACRLKRIANTLGPERHLELLTDG